MVSEISATVILGARLLEDRDLTLDGMRFEACSPDATDGFSLEDFLGSVFSFDPNSSLAISLLTLMICLVPFNNNDLDVMVEGQTMPAVNDECGLQ